MKNIIILQDREIAEAEKRAEEFFFDIPDAWYEPKPTYGCNNGHVSRAYLKSEEEGCLCLSCFEHIVILPHKYDTDEKLQQALKEIQVD